ncbi:GNAT family N-acetyltransferase [Micromonospora sp. NBC_01796]|uniref:GNAT family N-acetyltransferase n=1 Tax=Micromonospora sp. NBC_01796 TaxID=2975987 RepID=UPI002DDA1867|nr:GNAT family N-acetyltransferase [Micromonospora sp. NBC_01796]WSA87234.1 GNAT family N-acetyltransferase [Micromonospora sp. NBC_01796]
MSGSELGERLDCVRRSWNPRQRLHAGNVAWAGARGDGSPVPDATLTWGDPLLGFADVWLSGASDQPAQASLHLGPDLTAAQRAAAVDELVHLAPRVTVEVSDHDTALTAVLAERGFRHAEGPWFAQLWRSLVDLADLGTRADSAGYTIRPVRGDELTERVDVHRRCWAPARIKRMLGLPVTGDEPGSSYSVDKHRAVLASPVYHPELDLVAVAADGSFAAYGLGWLDVDSGSVLFEPVGTDPEHGRRGLAGALCTRMLQVARDLGADQAIVGPRGDNGYPLPRRLYTGLGMHEVARFIPMTR